jgi:serine/threonine-protein kinase
MELLQGMDLRALQDREGILTLPRTLRIALQVCSALGAAHQAGIIHRDLKPDNIFLIERGGRRDFVKLLDFGVAKLMNATLDEASTFRSSAGMVVGTPNYMAPEQALGHKVNHLADVYAMGVILFEMVAGRRPFVADTAREVMVQHLTAPPPRPSRLNPAGAIPEPLEALILACLRKEPEDRPQSIGEVEQRLREILRRLPAGGSGNPMRGLRAHRRAGLAVGATLLLALAVGGGLAWLRGGGSAWRGGRRVVSAARPVPRSPRPMPALAAPAAAGAPVPTATAAAPAVESPAPAPPPDPPASPRVEAARRPGRSVAPATERASAAVPVAGAGGRRRATKLDRSAVLNPFE